MVDTLQARPHADVSEHARAFHRCGFNVIPMRTDRKAPALKEVTSLHNRFQTEQEINAHNWTGNIGFVNGVNCIRTIDIDACDSSIDVLGKVQEFLGLDYEYPWVASTPGKGGGWQIYICCECDLTLTSRGVLVGLPLVENTFGQIELRWQDCYTMLPPSIHPETKTPYEWNTPENLPTTDLATVSIEIVEKMFTALATVKKSNDQADQDDGIAADPPTNPGRYDPWSEKALRQELDKLLKTTEGARNTQLNEAAYHLGQIIASNLLEEQDVTNELTRVALTIGLDEEETENTIKSGIEDGKKKPRLPKRIYSDNEAPIKVLPIKAENTTLITFSADDQGNAEAVYTLVGRYIAYNESYGWMCWNGTHFVSSVAQINNLIVDILRKRWKAAKDLDRPDILKVSAAMASRVAAARTLLENICHVDVSEFDNEPDLINTLNGIVDTRTKKIFPHDPSHRFTWCTTVVYKPDALNNDLVPWHKFLRDTVDTDEMRKFLQMALGYSITGNTVEEYLFYIFGPPRSGKGTLSGSLMAIFPRPIFMEVDFLTFTQERKGDTQNFDLAPMKAARLVFASESNKYQSLNPAKVKALTGGNEINCAFKYGKHFQYQPQYTIWLSSNHEINADADDDAIWGRLKCIEFPHTRLGKEDKSLKRRMLATDNLECMLAWLVEGAFLWHKLGPKGLQTPDEVKQLTEAQRKEQDTIGLWLDECCKKAIHLETAWVAHTELVESYTNWCNTYGFEPKKAKGFSQSLAIRGYEVGVRQQINTEEGEKRARGVKGLIHVNPYPKPSK